MNIYTYALIDDGYVTANWWLYDDYVVVHSWYHSPLLQLGNDSVYIYVFVCVFALIDDYVTIIVPNWWSWDSSDPVSFWMNYVVRFLLSSIAAT